jgi:hypothetical protein
MTVQTLETFAELMLKLEITLVPLLKKAIRSVTSPASRRSPSATFHQADPIRLFLSLLVALDGKPSAVTHLASIALEDTVVTTPVLLAAALHSTPLMTPKFVVNPSLFVPSLVHPKLPRKSLLASGEQTFPTALLTNMDLNAAIVLVLALLHHSTA